MTYNYGQIARFLGAQTLSLFGSALTQYAIIWYITLKTSSGLMMTIATVCAYLPQIVISLFAGVLLDRYDRKLLMVLSDAVIAISTLIVAILFLAGYDDMNMLFIALAIRSAGAGIQTPAVSAFIPQITPDDKLMKVNGINNTLLSLSFFLSPALSAVALSYLGITGAFFIDVITAAIGISIMIFGVKSPGVPPRSQEDKANSALDDLKAGLRYIKRNLFIKWQLIYIGVISLLVSPAAFLTPLLISRSFGPEVWRLSLGEMTFSLGAMLGGLLISSWGGFKEHRITIIFASVFYGLMMVAMGLASVFTIYLVFNFIMGIFMPCYNTPITVMFQQGVKPSMQGRVFSVLQICTSCALPAGTVIFGPMADIVSVQLIIGSSGAAIVLFALFAWRNKRFARQPGI